MRYEIMQEWVKALRSGKYEQGRRFLRSSGRFCCLGVLCDISQQGKWLEDSDCNSAKQYYAVANTVDHELLPTAVKDWAGLNTVDGYLSGLPTLTEINDDTLKGGTFAEIADIIERNWETL